MLVKYLVFCLTLTVFGAKAAAQSHLSPFGNRLSLNPGVDTLTLGNQSVAPFLQSVTERSGSSLKQNARDSVVKACPMPVHRPDTSRLERIMVLKLSVEIGYSMPRPALKCRNPLDLGK